MQIRQGPRAPPLNWCFRILFRLPPRLRLDIDGNEWPLVAADDDHPILLRSVHDDERIKDADWLVVVGKFFDTEPDALRASRMWHAVLEFAFARVGIAADFGTRAPKGQFTDAGLQLLQQQTGRKVLNEVHGIHMHECEPPPLFARTSINFVVGKGSDKLHEAISVAAASSPQPDPVRSLAFDLYSASFFESSADARLLMLMMGVETLIDLQPRSENAQQHVRKLLRLTEDAPLPESEIASLKGSLNWLLKESISAAGRRLATTLEPRTYMGKSPRDFFTICYQLRSDLVHGSVPRPAREEVDSTAAHLETFVGNLLSGDLLNAIEV